MRTRKLGLTGGIGSGKSTVATMLAEMQLVIIDADAISRQSTGPHGLAIDAIEKSFGSSFVTPERALNRQAMRDLVFNDPDAKIKLEELLHPLVGKEISRQVSLAEAASSPLVVLDIPLLVESSNHWREQLDRILVVDCSEATQIARVQQRSNLAPAQIQRIISSQATRQHRLKAADFVIFNDGLNMNQLRAEVQEIAAIFGL